MNQPRSRRRSRTRYVRFALVALLLLVLSACADAPQDALEPAGDWARKLDRLWDAAFWIAVAIFLIVETLLVVALVRFRNRPGNDSPRQVHGSTPLEIGWTILPALILAALAVPTVATIFDLAGTPDDAVHVKVVGHQWWWEFQYTDEDDVARGVVTANELHIPAGRDIALELESYDVIHSFWVPQLAGKLDVVPGRTNRLTLKADGPGVFLGQCAEFCGLSHANMRVRVVAHDAEGYEEWAAGQLEEAEVPEGGDALEGYQLFASKGCVGCHSLRGHEASGGADVGPDLTHLQSRSTFAGAIFDLTSERLREWLADPPAMKPMQPDDGIGMPDLGLTDEEIDSLVAYLETLQ